MSSAPAKSNLHSTIEKMAKAVDELAQQKNDTANLKNSYREFAEQKNAEHGKMKAHIDAIEAKLNNLILKVDGVVAQLAQLESITF